MNSENKGPGQIHDDKNLGKVDVPGNVSHSK